MTRDEAISALDAALRTVFAGPLAQRPTPGGTTDGGALSPAQLPAVEKTHAAGLMRINHVGEVCAQALYTAQALATKSEALRGHYTRAATEENDHLAWTAQRLHELGARPSLFNPLWYGGAFVLGFAAGKLGDRISLGFLQETEIQVEAHLESHLTPSQQNGAAISGGLPLDDSASRAIVAQMRDEEAAHAAEAARLGAQELPSFAKDAMRAMANLMKTVAYRV